ncbi:Thyroid adenoma-associated protein like protein [Habropoda laboriosa]|uniref:Thyroid adenoma-associated protein like protein n=1 Tax=Habropoda laboriosa TaxID=597456 RepID=A0A0L7RIE5_9HYME|nr:PREDICTED: thyroid adenoma-associated protein homolog [Habropoda laboriosa]KOC70573.1 Thyroid adenoma-associated protein like protein [Habropoda laboriosa]
MFTPQEIKKQLKELLVLKRSGELDSEEKIFNSNDEYWRDSVTYSCLEHYVYHHDEEIKLNTLALVVESRKSTLKFKSKELDIVVLFLQVNFKEKLEFVPLIKKALKRMKDSLAVVRRQCMQEEKIRDNYKKTCSPSEVKQEILDASYKISSILQNEIDMYCNVFQSIRNMCICSPDATYNRRKSSLQILLLMKDFLDNEFKHICWKAEQVEALFDLMLLDTYEGNKEMAFNLIKSVEPSLLQLDNESRVCDIITVAIELGNRIRPIDSITAASMLKVSMLSPIVKNVLENQLGITRCSEDITEAPLLQLILILLEKLKESLTLAKQNIVKTVTKHSLYGYLFCIRNLLQECNLKSVEKEQLWQNTIAELISACFQFSHAVSLIVNNSSPEGHLPMDLNIKTINEICDSVPEKQIVTPQMVLLCSWRTIKEVSLLFGLLATEAPICEDNPSVGLLNEEQIIRIGEHLVSLLTETKHRGAFEQAHIGFNQLCTRLWRLNKTSLNQLPKLWLHQIMTAITGIKENSKLCATRRSAGVPFMIQALLSTEPRQHKDTKTTTFDCVMKILLGLTQLESENVWDEVKELMYSNSVFTEYKNLCTPLNAQVTEIKTHALNVLRGIFRHSHLAEVVNNYVEDGLIAAFKSYDASTWAERNAATLLFSALIIRIFGVQRTKDHINLTTDNKMNYRVFFEKYPNLLLFILEELQTFVGMEDTLIKSNVQSILLLLSRLYQSHNSEPSDVPLKVHSNDLIHLVIQCGKSAIFETRKLAARALVPLLTEDSVGCTLKKVVENIMFAQENRLTLNLVHGYMLQVHEILKYFNFKSFESLDIGWNEFFKKTIWMLENLEQRNSKPPCFLLAEVYVKVCSEICKTDKTYLMQQCSTLNMLVSHLLHEKLKQGPARELYKLSAMEFVRSIARETSLIHQCILIKIYLHNLTVSETQIIAWSNVIEIINEVKYNDVSVSLLDYAADQIRDSIEYFHTYSPELQDAIFDFLYNSLIYLDQIESSDVTRKIDICKFVLNNIRLNDNKHFYYERDCYRRLLGKSYVTLSSLQQNEGKISLECTCDVLYYLCDYLWIATLSGDFRRSVFEIMQDLFLACYKRDDDQHVKVQWWSTVLQLLLDNNRNVRHEAFLLIDHVPVHCTLSNNVSHLNLLLSKFYEWNVRSKNPEFMCVAIFYWSIALLCYDTDYEMDDTDVFNKCINYDFFEPVEVSKTCAEFIIKNMKRHIDVVLGDDAIDWINAILNVEFQTSITFRTLVKSYEIYVPAIENKLQDILNPTYKSKLLQVLAYKEYKKIF